MGVKLQVKPGNQKQFLHCSVSNYCVLCELAICFYCSPIFFTNYTYMMKMTIMMMIITK